MEDSCFKWIPILEKPFQMSSRNLKCLDWHEDNYLFIGFQKALCALNLASFDVEEEDLNLPIKLQTEERDNFVFQRIVARLEGDDDLSDLGAEKKYLGYGELISLGAGKKEEDFLVVKGIPLRSLGLDGWLRHCIGAVVSGTSQNEAYVFVRKENKGSLILDTSSGSPWRNECHLDIHVGILADIRFIGDSFETKEESLLFCFCGTGGAELWRLHMNDSDSPFLEAHFLQQLTSACVGSCQLFNHSSGRIISLGEGNGLVSVYQLSQGHCLKVAQFCSDIHSIIIEQCWFHLTSNTWILLFCGGNSLCSVQFEFLEDQRIKFDQIAIIQDAHSGFISCICCNRWGHFASASLDGSVKLWTERLELITVIRNEDSSFSVHGLAFSPNGICLAVLGNIRLETDERLTGAKPHSSVLLYCPVEGELYERNYAEAWKYALDDLVVQKETNNMRPLITWDVELVNFRIWQARKDQNRIERFVERISTESHESIVQRRILFCWKYLAFKYFTQSWSEPLSKEQSELITEHICTSFKQLDKKIFSQSKSAKRKAKRDIPSISSIEQGAVEAMLRYLQRWQPQDFSEQWKHFGSLTDTDLETLEFCPVCKERNLLPCSRTTPLVSSCHNGHIFRRCMLSLLPIVTSNNSMTCPSCKSGAMFFPSNMEWLSERYVCILCNQPLSFVEMSAEQEWRLLKKIVTEPVG